MFSRFTIGKKVLVTGIGKCEGTKYLNRIGIVVCRDSIFNLKIILKTGLMKIA